MAWLADSLTKGRRDRLVLVAGGLVFWVIEGLGVAVDQWMGYRAEPTTAWATAGAWRRLAREMPIPALRGSTMACMRASPTATGNWVSWRSATR